MTYKEIAEKTTIPKKNLNSALIGLCNPKVKLLEKGVNKPTFDDDNEVIKLNLKFQNPALRVNVVPVANATKKKAAEIVESNTKLNDAVDRERGIVIDGQIVKIMKTYKTYKHADLVPKVMESISMFKAQPPQIKIRIEHLISQGYMMRDEKDRSLYIYIP